MSSRSTLRQCLHRRFKQTTRAGLRILIDLFVGDVRKARAARFDRAQWRRWYQSNRRWQRQLRAYKRLTGAKIDPRMASMPRWAIR